MSRPGFHRAIAIAVTVASLAWLIAVPVNAAVEAVTGNVTVPAGTTLTRTAVAVITLTDRSKDGAGTIIGQQRIDGATGASIPFSVPFESDTINSKHAYSVYASVTDAAQELQSLAPVPTITGGPTAGTRGRRGRTRVHLAEPRVRDHHAPG